MENTDTNDRRVSLLAHVISDVFSPLLVPTYGIIAAMWFTRLQYLPLSARLWAIIAVSGITALIPFLFILTLIRLGKVTDQSISDRRQRLAPFCLAILCYICAAVYLFMIHAPLWLTTFYAGAAIVTTLTTIINHWWKISAHCSGIAGLAGTMFWLERQELLTTPDLLCVSISLALVGIVAWARLYLRHHTVLQVFAGAVIAFAVEYSLLSLICN